MRSILIAASILMSFLCAPAQAQPQGDASIIFQESPFGTAAWRLNTLGYDAGSDEYGLSEAARPSLLAAVETFRRVRELRDPRYDNYSQDFFDALTRAQREGHRKWIYDAQQLLNAMGYAAGPETGVMNEQTAGAAAAFRSAVNIAGGRAVDANLVATLSSYQSQGHRAGGEAPAAVAPSAPGAVFRECAECPEMVVIPGGGFLMGWPPNAPGRPADRYPLRVDLPSFAIGRFEVTWDEWDACVRGGGCDPHDPSADRGPGRGRLPARFVSWFEADAYVQWLSRQTGQRYRLLSEAEWEYAAKAGSLDKYPWGTQEPVCDTSAPNGANFSACGDSRPHAVGSYPANAFGVFNLSGNVAEWVSGFFPPSLGPAPVPYRPSSDSERHYRGGSWNDGADRLRPWTRNLLGSGRFSHGSVGLRVAREL